MNEIKANAVSVDSLHDSLREDAEAGGYHLNPDTDYSRWLIASLIANELRYGYRACPCRLASGNREDDLDIICPCDYRDADLDEYDACYCALYVSAAVIEGDKEPHSIPERRPPPEQRKSKTGARSGGLCGLSLPVWRCKVCGYLCARANPPEACPICKAKAERFERFLEA